MKTSKVNEVAHLGFKEILAGAPGLEPGTYGFGDRRSTN